MSENNDSNINYTELEPSQDKYAYTYYVVPPSPKRKKQCGGGCCCMLLIAFFLCYFLIPRNPMVYLNKLIFDNSYNCEGTFEFKNNNYFSVDWKKPDISLYWIPYDGQTVGQVCYGSDDPCESDKYYKGICAIKLGEFKSDEKFTTNARTVKNENIKMLTSTQQEIACTTWMMLNPYENMPQKLLTSGHIHAKTALTDFGKVYISKQYYYY